MSSVRQKLIYSSSSVRVLLPCLSFSSTWAGLQMSPALWCRTLALFPWHFCSRLMWCCWTSPGQQCPWMKLMKPKVIKTLHSQRRVTETLRNTKQLIGRFDPRHSSFINRVRVRLIEQYLKETLRSINKRGRKNRFSLIQCNFSITYTQECQISLVSMYIFHFKDCVG